MREGEKATVRSVPFGSDNNEDDDDGDDICYIVLTYSQMMTVLHEVITSITISSALITFLFQHTLVMTVMMMVIIMMTMVMIYEVILKSIS